MTEQEFIKERVDGQMAWYKKKAAINKKYHYWSRGGIIILSAAIPVITLVDFDLESRDLVIGCIGAIIAILAGLSALMGYQEKWTEYRMAAESLLHEKMVYLTQTESYRTHPEPFDLFVSRIEEILNSERFAWNIHATHGVG